MQRSVDSVNYGGAVTVARDPSRFDDDPFARIFPGTVVRTSLFSLVLSPPGPVIERYSGVAWPGGSFRRRLRRGKRPRQRDGLLCHTAREPQIGENLRECERGRIPEGGCARTRC